MNDYKDYLDKVFEKERHSVLGFFISRHRIVYLIVAVILVFGTIAMMTLPRESEPEVKIPMAVVTTLFQGANPSDVEDLVTDVIEAKIKNLEDLKGYTSSSSTGYSSVVVEFRPEADLTESINKLKDRVDEAIPELPEDVQTPIVGEVSASDFPIITYSFFGEYSDEELKKYADKVQEELEVIKDVNRVPIIGGIEREYQVLVDQRKLSHFDLSLSQVVAGISQTHFNLPSGSIEIDELSYNVRVEGKFESIDDLKNVVVTTKGEVPVYVRDVATVKDGFKKRNGRSRMGVKGGKALNTISLQIYKNTGGNILKMVDRAEERIQEINESGELPSGLRIVKTNDNAVFIREDLRQLGMSGLQTMILIIILLFSVLNLRGALITGFSVPLAFLMTFIILQRQGMTLNGMVLFSLVLALGLMVDNSIIVMEGVNEYMKKYGKSTYKAAILAMWNYRWAITAGTLTTVAAFVPMLLVSGVMGEYMSIIPKTVSAALLSSLFISLLIIPTIAARKYSLEKESKKWLPERYSPTRILGIAKSRYEVFMTGLLSSKRKRRWSIAIAAIIFIVVMSFPMIGVLKVEMFSSVDIDYFAINIETPVGSSLEITDAVIRDVEDVIKDLPELDNYVSNSGSSFNFQGASSGNHLGHLIVNLVPEEDRSRKSYEITEAIRDDVEGVQGGEITIQELSAGPPTGAPIEVRLYGDDLQTLATISGDVENILQTIPGVINVNNNLQESTGEITFRLDKERLSYFGLNSVTLSSAVRSALYGSKAASVTLDGEDIDVTVKYNEGDFNSIDDLQNIEMVTPSGQHVKLREVVDISLEPSVLSINHLDGDKVVRVSGYLEGGTSLVDVLKEFKEKTKDIEMPSGHEMVVGGEVEDIQQSYTEMFQSMIVAVFLIILILVLQFNSFKQPFIIMLSLPLALIGALVGLTIMQLPFSLPAFIGIVSLSGIVVNDAIVLIDRINKNLKRGMAFVEGIVEAGVARMEPILLTSATTIGGIFPLAMSDELWRGLGFTVIWGLLFATILTLVMVPILFYGISKKDFEKSRTIDKV